MTDGHELGDSTLRGVIGAMAMTGMRAVAVDVGLLERPPPAQLTHEAAPALLGLAPDGNERAVEELVHWAVGAAGGVGFAVLPAAARQARWAGPAYGLAIWLAFELAVAPGLGLSHHRRHGIGARLVLIADHTLYGLILSEPRERPRR